MTLKAINSNLAEYTFVIKAQDPESEVVTASINDSAIRVTGPLGFNKPAILVSKNPASGNAFLILATYKVAGPFSASTNGVYTVNRVAGAITNTAGKPVTAGVVDTFECLINAVVEGAPPEISLNTPLGTLYTTTQTYYAAIQATNTKDLVDTSALSTNSLRLKGGDGTDKPAKAINLIKNQAESSVFILASWAGPFANNVSYSIQILAGSIKSKAGKPIVTQTIPGSITAQPPSAGGGYSANFVDGSITSVPPGWIVPATATASIDSLGLKAVGGNSGGWVNSVKSPNFPATPGHTVTITSPKLQGLAVFGITSETGAWGSFSKNDVLIFSAGNGGSLHRGSAELANNIGYENTYANQLAITFGTSVMIIVVRKGTASGDFVQTFTTTAPMPAEFSAGVRVLLSPHNYAIAWVSKIESSTANVLPANVLSQRIVPAEFYGYNGAALAIDDWNTVDKNKFGASTKTAGASILRWPGGDESNFWDYTRNGLITNSEDILPLAPWHTHGRTLPIWLAYQIEKTTATPANIKALHAAAGNPGFIYVVNCTTSTPQEQILALQAQESAGFTITHIELGNELFFNIPYYVGDADRPLRGHTSPAAFAADMVNNWIPAMRAQWPNAKIYVLGTPDYSFKFGREANWNYALRDAGCFAAGKADGLTIHPYYNIVDLNLDKSAVGSTGRASVAGKLAHAELGKVLKSASLDVMPEGKEIICTEFSVLEDSSQTKFVVLGQTWLQGLIQVQNVKIMLRDKRVTMALLHSLLSNPQWEGVSGEDGTAMDPAKRGVVDVPFTEGLYPPLEPTLQGYVLGLFANNALNGGGTGYLLADSPGYMAWRIKSATRDRIAITNTTADVHTFAPPFGSAWTFERWTNPPWFDVVNINQVPPPVTGTLIDGGVIQVPAFSIIILAGTGTAEIPGQVQPPSVILTPPSSRFNSLKLLTPAQIGTTAPVSTVNLISVRPTV